MFEMRCIHVNAAIAFWIFFFNEKKKAHEEDDEKVDVEEKKRKWNRIFYHNEIFIVQVK